MLEDELQRREWLSALVDGQLEQSKVPHAVSWVASSEEALATWHAYHVVGDVLRCPDLADCGGDQAFLGRFRARLAQTGTPVGQVQVAEPDHLRALDPALRLPVGTLQTVVSSESTVHAANDATLRWKWLAAAASLMAVAVLGWHVGTLDTMQLAAAPDSRAPTLASAAGSGAEPAVMLRDARLDEMLAAHRQFGGTSALQMPAGFLRNATFEPPDHR